MRHRFRLICLAAGVMLVFGLVGRAQAQHVRLLGGATFGTVASDADSGMTFGWLPGAAFGGGLEWRRGMFVPELDVVWVQKRGRYESRGWDFTVSEIGVPVLVGIGGSGRVGPFGLAGAEIAYVLSAVQDDVSAARRVAYDTPTFDCGLVVGGGVAFAAGGRRLTVEARYTHGLTRTMKFYSDGYDFRTRAFMLLGGFVF